MKNKLLSVLAGIVLFLMPEAGFGQTAPTLGTAANFVLFTTNGAMTNSGVPHLTHLTGNVGSNLAAAISGFGNVDGQMHDFDVATGACAPDVLSLYAQLNGATSTATLSTTLGGGTTLNHGVYKMLAATTLGGNLNLDALGDPGAVFIFQIQGSLSTNTLSKVNLLNGAQACNVFWKVEGLVSMGTGTTMRGTILANNAAINMGALDTLEGRALSINGAVAVTELLAYTPIGCGSPVLTGPAAPAFSASGAFGVFSSIGAVSSTPITYVKGDVGSNSTTTTGFNPLNVTGTIHTIPDATTASAAGDLTNVYNYLNTLPEDIDLLDPSNFGFNLVLTPHTYLMTPATFLNDTVFLNAEGDADGVFVIRINGAFSTTTSSYVKLINGAQAKNVYWLINGAVHIFDNSVFNGTLVVAGAITLNTGDTLNGRALTINGAIAINGSYLSNVPMTCAAPAINGTTHICPGGTTTLTDSTTGGTWSSSNTTRATIGSSSGIATGVTPGTSTILYTTSTGCQSTVVMTVNSAPNAITGPGSVCAGSTISLTDTAIGGTWSSSNTSLATVGTSSGIVTGVAAGTPIITYALSTGCMAFKTITVNASSGAGTITGSSGSCVGSSFTLSDTATGGTWTSSNTSVATIGTGSGIVTGVSAGTSIISYMLSNMCGTAFATKTIAITTSATAGTISGPSAVCAGSNISLASTVTGGTWMSSNPLSASVSSLSGVVTGVSPGTATISYNVSGTCGIATSVTTITVISSPSAGSISGPSVVCTGSSINLTDGATGGVWSSSNTSASVAGGTVTGLSPCIDTIMYTVSNLSCSAQATKTITINSSGVASVITGPGSVCIGSSITLSDIVTGGTWSSANTTATVSGGIVTGISAGTDIISYAVSGSCGAVVSTKTITINSSPVVASISGPASVCTGSSITLTDGTPGGAWSSSNTSTLVAGGIVTGVIAGIDIISYTVSNFGCSAQATKAITINAPGAGNITGPTNVCVGSGITLSDIVAGGAWSAVNSMASILGGVVTGVSAGIDTIVYTVSNSCGISAATKTITVNPLPNAGTITGPASVCVGSSITVADVVTDGIWSVSNARATIAGVVVTGVSAGVDTIMYTVSGSCGIAVATKTTNVMPLPYAGIITGAGNVCVSAITTLSDFVTSGVWSSVNSTATVTGGVVTGVSAGTDTIVYTFTNSCGTDVATKTITVNPLPNSGSVTGLSIVCVGSGIPLVDVGGSAGVWSVTNALATISAGLVTGVSAGLDTVRYTVTNGCGVSVSTKNVLINPLPNAGTISGAPSVCVGSTNTLTDGAAGGVWSSNNASATVLSGIVTGVTAGIDTIIYSVTNSCGTAITPKQITVNPLPNADVITGLSSVCVNSTILLADTAQAAGGTWSSSNASATVSLGLVTGVAAGLDTIGYEVTNVCGSISATKTITVNPLPDAGIITGASNVCVGSAITLTDNRPGGIWSSKNTLATVVAGVVSGITAGGDVISYAVTNICGTATATKTITINLLPVVPVITTQSPSAACTGTMYQNFGTATPPSAFTFYNWTASNATVWAEGVLHQYALVNFNETGFANVTLNVTTTGTTCVSHSTVTVNVGGTVAQTDKVYYFNNHFICSPSNDDSYQWGYDNVSTLDSTILTGEINQDYINTNPDFTNKYYWCMTTSGSCLQKTYYTAPLTVQNVNSSVVGISVYPNPATSAVTVALSGIENGDIRVEILNMMGQKMNQVIATDNKATIDVAALPSCSYFINCYRNNVNIAHSKFVKN